MKQYCHYHATRTAHWHCHHCGKNYCPPCIEKRNTGGDLSDTFINLCPGCIREVSFLGTKNIIDPFWNRLHTFFVYPLHFKPLIFNAIIAAIPLLILEPSTPLFKLVQFILWGIWLCYAYFALQRTTMGNLSPPHIDVTAINKEFGAVLKQLIFYGVISYVFIEITLTFGPLMALMFMGGVIVFSPAMIMLLVTTGSIFAALNPMLFMPVVFRIGWSYILMYFFLLLLGSAPFLISNYAIQYMPPKLTLMIYFFAKNYYTLISYHLMGYVLLQYHEEIGFEIQPENLIEQSGPEKDAPLTPEAILLQRISQLVKDGNHTEAISHMEDKMPEGGFKDMILSEKYFTLIEMTQNSEKMLQHGSWHISNLIRNNQLEKARDIYEKCLDTDESFRPDALSLFKIGGTLNAEGAVNAYNRLVKFHPDHPLVPKTLYHLAKLFNEKLTNPLKAKHVLSVLFKKFPESDIVPLAQNYMKRSIVE